jgi:uncharacterized protein YrrD
MLLNNNQLKKVIAETQSGQYLGQVSDFELDSETGIIEKYYVKSRKIISGLFEGKFIINKNQIISLDDKKMIVEDGVIKAAVKEKKVLSRMENMENTTPVITSKES